MNESLPITMLSTIADARRHRASIAGPTALVPTMGALHDGHVALIAAARALTPEVWVSIFVNPAQFGPHEDFERYPRPVEDDLEKCVAAGATAIFSPSVDEMYPPGVLDSVVDVPALALDLEAAHREGHFVGVCRVCAKLFNICRPTFACFGQKDFQQLRVIESMVADLNMPLAIQRVPTVREADGLALSSRNRYLDEKERRHALGLSKALSLASRLVEIEGETDPAIVEQAMRDTITSHHMEVDYAVIRHSQTLSVLDSIDRPVVALVAGRLGKVRLLDNRLLNVSLGCRGNKRRANRV